MIRTAGALGAARAVVVEMAVEVAVGAGREATEAVAGMEGMAGEVVGSTEKGPMAPFDVSDQHTQAFLRSVGRGGLCGRGGAGGKSVGGPSTDEPEQSPRGEVPNERGPVEVFLDFDIHQPEAPLAKG